MTEVKKAKSKTVTKKPQEKITNSMAIAGFICSFFIQIVGLVLSIISLRQIKKNDDKGQELAIAGVVISSVFLFVKLLIAIFVIIIMTNVINLDSGCSNNVYDGYYNSNDC